MSSLKELLVTVDQIVDIYIYIGKVAGGLASVCAGASCEIRE